ncbi:MAG: phosphatidylserine decarboxylase family protein [Saprospirales bacterium]|nr:MAG: phosphatidylserine decarboxylase family protein [Saprospirales bacterium]
MGFIHREGYPTLILTAAFIVLAHIITLWLDATTFIPVVSMSSAVLIVFFLQFFRNPKRPIPMTGDHLVYAPADGKVVVVETTRENEYFEDERIQVSIFMSPINVHVNRAPMNGRIEYFKYHPGKYLLAWHPKSSELNERTTIVLKGNKGTLLLRQIAGMAARRIIFYPKQEQQVTQGEEIGFIKFGSRVDIFFPTDAKILVKPGDKVLGNISVIGNL